MAINFRSSTRVSNLRVGPLSGGGGNGGGGGGSSEPTFLVAGAPQYSSYKGRAYVYTLSNLSASPTILDPTTPGNYDQFGFSVASSADYIAVGTPYDDDVTTNSGAVYVYTTSNLSSTPTKLIISGGSNYALGNQVAIFGTSLYVGADVGNRAYIYDLTNLSASPTELIAPTSGRFGTSVAANSDYLAVGGRLDDSLASNAGGVYVYDLANPSASPTLVTANDGIADDKFGSSVAFAGTKLVVGAPEANDGGNNDTGAVYVYDSTNLSASPTKLTSSNGTSSDYLGFAVAGSSTKIVAGAYLQDNSYSQSGGVYVWDATNLSATPTKLVTSNPAASDMFGKSVAIQGSKILIGAPNKDVSAGTDAGAVYVYDATNLSASPDVIEGPAAGAAMGTGVSLG